MNIAIVGASGAVGQELIDRADRLYVTLVDHTFPDADTHFPDIDPAEWQLVREEPHPADPSNAFPLHLHHAGATEVVGKRNN